MAREHAVGSLVETDAQLQLQGRRRDADVPVDGVPQAISPTLPDYGSSTYPRTIVEYAQAVPLGAEPFPRRGLHGLGLCEEELVPMRVVLVGNGYFGSLYRERIKQHQHMELVAIVDWDTTKFTDDAPVTAMSLDHLIDNMDFDAVVIATPPDSHANLSMMALKASKHVFCAKPAAISLMEFYHLASVASDADAYFYVDYTMLAAPECNTIDQQFGILGEPCKMTSVRRVVTPTKPEGPIWDLLPHDAALFHYMMNLWEVGKPMISTINAGHHPNGVYVELIDTTGTRVGFLSAQYEQKNPLKIVTFDAKPHKHVTNPNLVVEWNQVQRSVTIASQDTELDLWFAHHPDPISLSLDRFYRQASAGFFNNLSQDEWVTQVLDAAERSLAEGEPVGLVAS